MKPTLALAIVVTAALGCGEDAPGFMELPDVDAATTCERAGPSPVKLTTDDGVDLLADLYTTGAEGQPGVILLHMIPPANSKDNYGTSFIEPLRDAGFQIINVNRRGAPGSDGNASEAYSGPNGKLDAKAAHDYLRSHPCAVPASSIAIVGASNGTTTMVDFAVFTAGDAGYEPPLALTFLSGGSYTENQTSIASAIDELDDSPAYFAYPPNEAGWNDGIEGIAPGSWQFVEYSPGGHGTHLFDSNPEVIADVVSFLAGVP